MAIEKNVPLETQLQQLHDTITDMNGQKSNYTVQSEYHRLMYTYWLELETIRAALNARAITAATMSVKHKKCGIDTLVNNVPKNKG